MTPRSVAFLANHGGVGGGEVMLLAMAAGARRLGVPCTVVGPAGSDVERAAAEAGATFVGLDPTGPGGYLRALTAWSARRHGVLLWGNGATAALATTLARDPAVVHLHQAPTRLQAAALAVARSRAVATVVPSSSMQRAVPGAEVLLNWTDPPAVPLDPPAPEGVRVGFIGRLSTRKGVDVLARACLLVRDRHGLAVELVVAGDDRFVAPEEHEPVAEALARLGPAVHHLGWVTRERFFADVDVVVVPSVWDEPFGLVAAEAMAHRRPVLVSAAGALPEIVGPDHPWVAAPADADALARALVDVLTDAEARSASVERARARWEELFSPDAGDRRLAALLAGLHA